MVNETLGITIMVLVILAIPLCILWGAWSVKHHNKKLREYYDNIKIGDRYSFSVGPLHPFDSAQTHYGEIINKTLAGGKHPWVQIRYDDGFVDQNELHDFLKLHKKIS